MHAVDGVDRSTIAEGEVVGLVGESGCGKSTTGRTSPASIPPSDGSVESPGVAQALREAYAAATRRSSTFRRSRCR